MKWFTRRSRGRPGAGDGGGSGEPPEGRAPRDQPAPHGGPRDQPAPLGGAPDQPAPAGGAPGAGDDEAWKRQVEAEARRRLKRGIKGVGERG